MKWVMRTMSITFTIAIAVCCFYSIGQQGVSKRQAEIGKRSPHRIDTPGPVEQLDTASKTAELARNLLDQGKYSDSIRICEEGLAEADTYSLRRVLAEALLRSGSNSEALSQLMTLNRSQSDDRSFSRIGLVLLRLGEVEASRSGYSTEIIGRYYSGSPGCLASIPKGRTNAELKGAWPLAIGVIEDIHANDSDALYYFRIAYEYLPNNALLNMRMGKVLLRKGSKVEAKECFRRAALGGTEELKRFAKREVAKLSVRGGSEG